MKELLNICRGDVVSIVGCNGKTTLLWRLARELGENFKVLASTTAKIGLPVDVEYNAFYPCVKDFLYDVRVERGITIVAGGYISEKHKLIGLSSDDVRAIKDCFDYTLLEADGSRGLPLKGWRDHEPPVADSTTKTIAVLPSTVIGIPVNDERVYGLEEFRRIVGSADVFDADACIALIEHEQGMFKNSCGEKIFLINIFDDEDIPRIDKFIHLLLRRVKNVRILAVKIKG